MGRAPLSEQSSIPLIFDYFSFEHTIDSSPLNLYLFLYLLYSGLAH